MIDLSIKIERTLIIVKENKEIESFDHIKQ
jgi:hypothetical protein